MPNEKMSIKEQEAISVSKKNEGFSAGFYVWLILTAVILIPALLLGGGTGWFIGAPLVAGVCTLVSKPNSSDDDERGRRSSIWKKLLIVGAAGIVGYTLGKKLEL
jgi:4-hydroxybenzoate polyprenyltransferase